MVTFNSQADNLGVDVLFPVVC